MSLFNAAAMHFNTFDGIAYKISGDVRDELSGQVELAQRAIFGNPTPYEDLSAFEMVHHNAGIVTPKSFDPSRTYGSIARYPFLRESMLELISIIPKEIHTRGEERKYLLKKILASSVPPELIYRKKSGFRPPLERFFALSRIRELVHDLILTNDNEILRLTNRPTTKRMFAVALAGRMNNKEGLNYLWSIIFLTLWLKQVRGQV